VHKNMEFLEALNPGWVGSLIAFLGLIGLIVTFFLYRASRIGPRPVYQYQALRLIGRKGQALPEDVTVLFRDKKVQRLTKTYIVLWNSGRAVVNGDNIVADDPLRIVFSEGTEVLSARVINFTRESNKFRADINRDLANEVICNFDYLDAGDGAAIELVHTDDKRYPEVAGSIRGIPKGVLDWGKILFPMPSYFLQQMPTIFKIVNEPIVFRIICVLAIFFGIFCIIYGFLKPPMPEFITSVSYTHLTLPTSDLV